MITLSSGSMMAALDPVMTMRTGVIGIPFGARGLDAVRAGAPVLGIQRAAHNIERYSPIPRHMAVAESGIPSVVSAKAGTSPAQLQGALAALGEFAIAAHSLAEHGGDMLLGDARLLTSVQCPGQGSVPGALCAAARLLRMGQPVIARAFGVTVSIPPLPSYMPENAQLGAVHGRPRARQHGGGRAVGPVRAHHGGGARHTGARGKRPSAAHRGAARRHPGVSTRPMGPVGPKLSVGGKTITPPPAALVDKAALVAANPAVATEAQQAGAARVATDALASTNPQVAAQAQAALQNLAAMAPPAVAAQAAAALTQAGIATKAPGTGAPPPAYAPTAGAIAAGAAAGQPFFDAARGLRVDIKNLMAAKDAADARGDWGASATISQAVFAKQAQADRLTTQGGAAQMQAQQQAQAQAQMQAAPTPSSGQTFPGGAPVPSSLLPSPEQPGAPQTAALTPGCPPGLQLGPDGRSCVPIPAQAPQAAPSAGGGGGSGPPPPAYAEPESRFRDDEGDEGNGGDEDEISADESSDEEFIMGTGMGNGAFGFGFGM